MLVRRILCTSEWARLSDGDPESANPPYQLLKEFLDNELSVYQVHDESEALKLAAALCMIYSTGPTRCLMVGINDEEPKNRGWKVRKSKGATAVKIFDENHSDIIVENLETLTEVLRSFIAGEIFDFNQKDISEAIKQLFRDDCYDVIQLAKSAKDVKSPLARGLLNAIASSLVSVKAA
jgi:hypothetical protein